MITLSIRPNPFDDRRTVREVEVGPTVQQLVELSVPSPAREQAMAKIGGEVVPRHLWQRVHPRDGVTVEVVVIPEGGGQFLRIGLTLGVLAAAAAAGPLVGGGIAGVLAASAVTSLGLLAVNSLVPPPQPELARGRRASPTYSIEGARNALRPFEPVPQVLGRHRIFPPLAARTYTEIAGNDVYLRMLVVWGISAEVSDLRIGETPLAAFEDVEVETVTPASDEIAATTLFSNAITQLDLNDDLRQSIGWIGRLTEPDVDEISIDVAAPEGLIRYSSNGKDVDRRTVRHELRYRPAAGGDWVTLDELALSGKTHSPVRVSRRWSVPNGQYEVQLRRATENADVDRIRDRTVWTSIRSITRTNPIAERGVAATAIRIRASAQLSGTIDSLNGIVQLVAPDFEASTGQWVERATSNPASLFRWVLQGPASSRPVSDGQLDLPALEQWHEYCELKGLRSNLVIDFEATTVEVLAMIAACGDATWSRPDGRWSVAIDGPSPNIVQDFTPRSITSFSAERVFIEESHALRVTFFNEEQGWRADERMVFADGFDASNATRIEDAELPGITHSSLAHRFARRMLARARWNQMQVQIRTDWRHLIAARGDVVRVAHDAVAWGTGWGRVVELEAGVDGLDAIRIDERVTMAPGAEYSALIQTISGSIIAPLSSPASAETDLLVLAAPLLEEVAPGDQVIVGERGRESQLMVVLERRGGSNLEATLTLVPYIDISSVDTEEIPPFETALTNAADAEVPIIESIQSNEAALTRDADGSVSIRPVVTIWSDGSRSTSRIAGLEVRWRELDSGAPWSTVGVPADTVTVRLDGVERGWTVEVQARWILLGRDRAEPGRWSPRITHEVVGPNLPPPDVASVWQDGELMRWIAERYADHAGFALRVSTEAGQSWTDSFAVHEGIFSSDFVTVELLPADGIELLVKAVTASEVESEGAVRATINRDILPSRHTFSETDYRAAGWPGSIAGGEVTGGDLVAVSTSVMWPNGQAVAWPDADGPAFDVQSETLRYEVAWQVPAAAIGSDVVEIELAKSGRGVLLVQWADGELVEWADDDDLSSLIGDDDPIPDPALDFGAVSAGVGPDLSPLAPYRGPFRVNLGNALRVVVQLDASTAAIPQVAQLFVRLKARIETEMQPDRAIAAGGTRMPTQRSLRQIIGVNALLTGSGSADLVRVLDKSDPVAGALLAAYAADGSDAGGVADIAITGV